MATVKTTIRQGNLPTQSIIAAALRAVDTTLASVDVDFQSTFSTFTHKPIMHKERAKVSGTTVTAREWTDDENYVRLNYGTDAHLVGRSGQYMSFYPTYYTKTRPGVMKATAGKHFGQRQRAKGPWMVRGIDARHFDRLVAGHNQPILEKNVQQELSKIK